MIRDILLIAAALIGLLHVNRNKQKQNSPPQQKKTNKKNTKTPPTKTKKNPTKTQKTSSNKSLKLKWCGEVDFPTDILSF